MIVYRIAKRKARANDLSGTGAYNEGGRWNNAGTFALYSTESISLALLEVLVHVEASELPPHLFIMTIQIDDTAPILTIKPSRLPANWRIPENLELKSLGDNILRSNRYLAIKGPSAVVPGEYNYILNPQFPRFFDLVKVKHVNEYTTDSRLM